MRDVDLATVADRTDNVVACRQSDVVGVDRRRAGVVCDAVVEVHRDSRRRAARDVDGFTDRHSL